MTARLMVAAAASASMVAASAYAQADPIGWAVLAAASLCSAAGIQSSRHGIGAAAVLLVASSLAIADADVTLSAFSGFSAAVYISCAGLRHRVALSDEVRLFSAAAVFAVVSAAAATQVWHLRWMLFAAPVLAVVLFAVTVRSMAGGPYGFAARTPR